MTTKIKKLDFVEAVVNAKSAKSDQQLADELRVSRVTFWRYKKRWRDDIIEKSRQRFAMRIPSWHRALDNKASVGDFQSMRLAFEMVGEYTPRQETVTHDALREKWYIEHEGKRLFDRLRGFDIRGPDGEYMLYGISRTIEDVEDLREVVEYCEKHGKDKPGKRAKVVLPAEMIKDAIPIG